ncbi:antibiotic biosynthesis monooxygenase [Brevibacillus sp. DP1.3A]|nr:antibiotic biosynthesis monooxygenase [Brevibacillus sp. DP1.3A]
MVAASQAEKGNVGYTLLKSTEQEYHYTMIEKWKDAAVKSVRSAWLWPLGSLCDNRKGCRRF